MSERGELLDLGSDLALRYRYFSRESMAHPAKLHLGLLSWLLDRYTRPGDTIADPMAGIGSTAYAALLQRHVILREIEPKWLAFAHENAAIILREAGMFAGTINIAQADAREPWSYTADHIVFSPPYGCAFAPNPASKGTLPPQLRERLAGVSHHARWDYALARMADGDTSSPSMRGFFLAHYGRHPAQLGHLRGDRYWAAMTQIYTRARAALKPDGKMILVIKDHVRRGVRIRIADQTVAVCESLGFVLIERHARLVHPLSLWQRRRKERGELIVEEEDALVFQGVDT